MLSFRRVKEKSSAKGVRPGCDAGIFVACLIGMTDQQHCAPDLICEAIQKACEGSHLDAVDLASGKNVRHIVQHNELRRRHPCG